MFRRITVALIAVAAIASVFSLDLGGRQLSRSMTNAWMFFERAVPPDASVIPLAARAMVETLQMALLGTLAATVVAVPLSLLAARNVYPGVIGAVSRTVLACLRVMPSILWALIFVAVVGLGPLAGVLALTVYSVGMLGKLQYEAIEGLPRDAAEALTGCGVSRIHIIRHAVIPESANQLLAHVLFVFEYNVRHGSVLGIVGAGGIGTLLTGYLTFFQMDKLVVVLAVILVTVLVIDAASHHVRRKFTDRAVSFV
ncbi:phosphonate ABC transporter, permease protein PhnE [Hoyosella rhizosphaerae]|uniref:ABC transmembrane type-1 domain-containing protein n=1 Tax=Hoyosella rhizosphaerae TaxID=1755582 RepID=A0A916UGI7_9ACTN|nr:phosphonate ABC transporter, permease protein PhnE [Hoyosella rhizosphaerae]MBN4928027.1 phosphonate ABC transporter, permease protein PhnE [Hoyosella rhizosphaerae]GGC71825.1 hypothetical protein GCM10011410_26060 [Hoyosella rhizosphaerae]